MTSTPLIVTWSTSPSMSTFTINAWEIVTFVMFTSRNRAPLRSTPQKTAARRSRPSNSSAITRSPQRADPGFDERNGMCAHEQRAMLAADAAVAGSYPVCADSGQGAVLTDREFGMGRGKVFPASSAKSLLNPLRRIVQSPRRTVAAMTLPRSGRVAEIGAGPGFFSPAIADVVPDGVVIVVDLQVEMVQLARGRLRGRSNTQFVVADAATAVSVIEHRCRRPRNDARRDTRP